MKFQAALILLSCVLFLGCKPAKEKEPEFTNLPPEVKAQLDTPEGREIVAAAKKLQAENTRKKLKLLNNTDHSALFEACKLVITNRRAWEKSNYGFEQSLIAGKSTNTKCLWHVAKHPSNCFHCGTSVAGEDLVYCSQCKAPNFLW